MAKTERLGRTSIVGLAAALMVAVLLPIPTAGAQVVLASTATSSIRAATAPRPVFWFPFRGSVKVGCVVNNCGPAMKGGHHYWAIDFSGLEGTAVNAAATGIAHIGGRAGCVGPSASNNAKLGNWVWIDHGHGRVTQYRHLARITIRSGQRVTPATRIGTMGHTGIGPCLINYTHFEYLTGARKGSPSGIRTNPGPMFGCVNKVRVQFPNAVNRGNADWNKLNGTPRYRVTITNLTSAC